MFIMSTIIDSAKQRQFQSFDKIDHLEFIPGSDENDIETIIRGVYKQVLGNAHLMESERLISLESQVKGGEISVREFVRQVAYSQLYRSLFFETCHRYRSIELNFKPPIIVRYWMTKDGLQRSIPTLTVTNIKIILVKILFLIVEVIRRKLGRHC